MSSISHKTLWKSNVFESDLDSICVIDKRYVKDNANDIVLVTAKKTSDIYEFNLSNGQLVNIWKEQWKRPNGIASLNQYVAIVERDGKLLTIYNYQTKKLIFSWGANILNKPYGISVDKFGDFIYLFITDNGKNKVVYKLKFNLDFSFISYQKILEFDFRTELESIYFDSVKQIILVADEGRYLIYKFDFNTNQLLGSYGIEYFDNEPEGISKYKNMYICTNQSHYDNIFYFFDDQNFKLVYQINEDIVKNTDGICVFKNILLVINDDKQLVGFELKT